MSNIHEREFIHRVEAGIKRRQRWGAAVWLLATACFVATITIARLICH